MTAKPSLLSVINSIVLIPIVLFLFFYFLVPKGPTAVYVDNVVLFSGFHMSADLNRINQEDLKRQKATVDSIVALLREQEKGTVGAELQGRFVRENNKLKEMGEYFTNNVSQQVWSRINAYMQEFGTENDYSLIMGTQGNGNIMYAKKELDITQEFLEYANRKYEGE